MRWYRKAADLGDAAVQCSIGHLYSQGLGVVRDDSTAMEWLLQSAK